MPVEKISVRVKLASLWTSVTLCYLYGDYFELYVPGKAGGLETGDNLLDSWFKLFLAAVLLAIPALMVSVSIVASPITAKKLSILFGVIYTGMMVFIAVISLGGNAWRTFYVLLAIVEAILTFLITCYAWKWRVSARMDA